MIDEKNKNEIIALFYFASDFVNEDINHIELCPIKLFDNTYLCGLQLVDENDEKIFAHLKTYDTKEITRITSMESALPIRDYYVDIDLLEEKDIINAFPTFKDNFFKLRSYTIANVTVVSTNHQINAICESKKITCKFVLNIRKLYGNTKQKFKHFGYLNNNNNKKPTQHNPAQEELALLEVVTSL